MCPINKTIGFFINFILISNQQQIGFFVLGGRGAKKNPSNHLKFNFFGSSFYKIKYFYFGYNLIR